MFTNEEIKLGMELKHAICRERIQNLEGIIEALLNMIDHGGPVQVDHVCGPESQCDGLCMEAARDNEILHKARQIVKNKTETTCMVKFSDRGAFRKITNDDITPEA